VHSSGLHLFLCTCMIMYDSIMLSEIVFNWKYSTHPLFRLKMQMKSNYNNLFYPDTLVELPFSFIQYCARKISGMFSVTRISALSTTQIKQPRLLLWGLYSYKSWYESIFIIHLLEDPSACFSTDQNTVPDFWHRSEYCNYSYQWGFCEASSVSLWNIIPSWYGGRFG